MAIVKVVNKTYTVDPLYQWDLNQVLEIHGLSFAAAPEVHFTNTAMVRAIRHFSTMDAAGIIRVYIPNTILQQAYKITALICVRDGEVFKTKHKIEIPVNARPQPADYTIRDDGDLYSFIELENLVHYTAQKIEESNAKLQADLTAKYNQVAGTVNQAVSAANTAVKRANAASENAETAAASVTGKVNKAGDTMTGDLDMGGKSVKNLPDPTDDGDAVRKSYAENASNLKTGIIPAERLPENTAEHIGALEKSGGTMTGPLVLTEGVHYGTEEQMPAPGTPGRFYLLVVNE